ncbi:MAG: hypothetical protein A2V88_08735 [Elusimicrobia bacterium RBG_16_66_12]|nr:MAG: hypothetical protein A2V88_08735 [Elusimicrobia bacterium RBG_16_66_12]
MDFQVREGDCDLCLSKHVDVAVLGDSDGPRVWACEECLEEALAAIRPALVPSGGGSRADKPLFEEAKS